MSGAPPVDAGPELIEREQESAVLDALVDRLREGGGAVVVRGEAGIGKSVLLQRVRRRAEAQGARPLFTVGVESEAELPFAGLNQLLRPVIGALAQLPESQRQTLEAALGLGVDLKPDSFRVAVAAFQLICESADSVPVVLIVDDAHWLDGSTLSVIAFIGRRLEAEHVALVAAFRSGQSTSLDDARLATLDLERLSASAAARLLDRTAPELHPVLRARVLAESSGNPLALVELARSMGRSGEQLSPPSTTLTSRLERAFASRLRDLSPNTRAGLLAAALDSRASLNEIARSSRARVESLQPAVDAALVEIVDDGVRFRHPLIRSAVRQAASAQQVLEMYRALAEVVADPERQVWHRAMAATGPDESIASALEQHARLAAGRGAVTVAGAALERAAALTADSPRKGARLVAAAEIAYELGLVDSARRLVDEAKAFDLGARDQARLDAERAEDAIDRAGPTIMPQTLRTFARTARKRMRTDNGGYRRDHLRALAQRVEVDQKELRIMGSKSVLLRTLVAASSAKTAGFGVPSSVPNWRALGESNPCLSLERAGRQPPGTT